MRPATAQDLSAQDAAGSARGRAPPLARRLPVGSIEAEWRRALAALRASHALTEREAVIVLHVVSGESVQSCAKVLGNSAGTVRTHLKAVFRKTGVRHQAHLWMLVAPLEASA